MFEIKKKKAFSNKYVFTVLPFMILPAIQYRMHIHIFITKFNGKQRIFRLAKPVLNHSIAKFNKEGSPQADQIALLNLSPLPEQWRRPGQHVKSCQDEDHQIFAFSRPASQLLEQQWFLTLWRQAKVRSSLQSRHTTRRLFDASQGQELKIQ